MLRYRVTGANGKRVEHATPIGLVRQFPKDTDAWREVDRLGILIRINDDTSSGRIRFSFLAEQYLKADFVGGFGAPEIGEHHQSRIVRAYLVPRFGNEMALIRTTC